MRGVLSRCCAAVVVLAAATSTGAAPAGARAGGPVLVIDGRGFGHGVGMAQDGLFWMAKGGSTAPQILAAFYPGTTIGRAGGTVRVVVAAAADRQAVLVFPDGGTIDSDGGDQRFPIRVGVGGRVVVGHDGSHYWVATGSAQPSSSTTATTTPDDEATTTTTTMAEVTVPSTPPATDLEAAPGSTTSTTAGDDGDTSSRARSSSRLSVVPNSGGSVGVGGAGRRYRGRLDVALDGGGLLRVVNTLDVEQYLRGMGEVRDSKWPVAGLRGQAIAARTYALRAMAAGGEICADQRCQVYLGAQAEYAAMNKAVADTRGQVVLYKGKLASTVYSANGGGHSASREEGFGTTSDGYPYLRSATYTTKNQLAWTVKVGLADVAARLGYGGSLQSVTVARTGPSGRALEVSLVGSSGTKAVPGRTFDARLGLKSTLFTLKLTDGVAPPPPPADAAEVIEQAPPEEAASLPPRPPDPPLPDGLLARPEPRVVATAPAAVRTPTRIPRESSNVPLAVFVLVTLGLASGVSYLSRRQLP
ncbi:MAG TPA: SpoIID/LytB domain-containing protein [Acidimicrobiales bacterium]|nr:SpoIID/LytB domain-containing protein [Acidimicrobiales bacterium]